MLLAMRNIILTARPALSPVVENDWRSDIAPLRCTVPIRGGVEVGAYLDDLLYARRLTWGRLPPRLNVQDQDITRGNLGH